MWIGLIILVALMIPVVGILVDSPIGRALARRLEGPGQLPPDVAALQTRLEVLETEVEELRRTTDGLRDENEFLQRLMRDPTARATLPPAPPP